MIRQASAWGQFWFDLRELHGVSGGAIFTPHTDTRIRSSFIAPGNAAEERCTAPYTSLWVRFHKGKAVYTRANGVTMTGMLSNGLVKHNANCLRMQLALCSVQAEFLTDQIERLGL